MATFAIHIVDSDKGMVSTSFTITEDDMSRMMKALNYIYTNDILKDSSKAFGQKDVFDAVFKKKPLNNSQICTVLGSNIINGLINTVQNVEVELFTQELRANHKPVKILDDRRGAT